MARQRRNHRSNGEQRESGFGSDQIEKGDSPREHAKASEKSAMTISQKWLVLAVASGAFAALNGVFAKLTTAQLTANISQGISHSLSLSTSVAVAVEYIVRAFFFGLNILSNITMWALFTRALTAASSSTQVTITNTTANFLATALLGMVVFQERVAPQWWLGATIMAAGSIIVGLRDEGKVEDSTDERRGDGDGRTADLIEFQDERALTQERD
ncbi:predicted protein [Uncinocarpus reesii 1704]|uniref:EamA domain-containing protein n=1 Tax=Uncinocarpus reesii (strain UAMH 1704) TaxID=336963 RepID=C4JDD2_UNCRE|nr:uncharacterized protein UREG_00692 [Uncinocarpus reesii 1704]EEP75845.1 predicted protein [Uncinocarpus reesii 1704]